MFETSSFEGGVSIKACVRNFDLRELNKKILQICSADPGLNAQNSTLVIATTATDLSEMEPFEPYVENWFAGVMGGGGALDCGLMLVFEVEVDCEALGVEGVTLLAKVLDGLLIYRDTRIAPIRLVSAPGPLQRRLMDQLMDMNVPVELVAAEARQL